MVTYCRQNIDRTIVIGADRDVKSGIVRACEYIFSERIRCGSNPSVYHNPADCGIISGSDGAGNGGAGGLRRAGLQMRSYRQYGCKHKRKQANGSETEREWEDNLRSCRRLGGRGARPLFILSPLLRGNTSRV